MQCFKYILFLYVFPRFLCGTTVHRPVHCVTYSSVNTDTAKAPRRTLLPGKFDLPGAFEERDRIHRISETREQLREAKMRIARSLQRLPFDPTNVDQVVVTLVLETVCEEVTLLLMDVRIDTDVRTFANAALFWALRDVDIAGIEVLLEEEFLLMNRYRFANIELVDGLEVGHILKSNGTRKMLLGAIHAPFSRSNWATLHRRLPWPYVCPSHEKGHPKYYPNVRERIDETSSKGEDRVAAARSSCASDLTCYHFEDVSNNADVAYKRKSKFAAAATAATPPQIVRALLVDMVDLK
ncbi:uncharacterized protein LOC117223622 isoform X1 [Megalopta genalis]|uniref:uncharacterized protein LOC117223622 isoform X1 n=2 Tax=Megalopta genalis TaxID=115081 RepID=UPI003FCF1E4E